MGWECIARSIPYGAQLTQYRGEDIFQQMDPFFKTKNILMTLRREKNIFNSLLLDRVLFWLFLLMACQTETPTSLVVIHTLKKTLEGEQNLPCLSSKSFRLQKENDIQGMPQIASLFLRVRFCSKKGIQTQVGDIYSKHFINSIQFLSVRSSWPLN
jgi:hypothetical protein